MSFFDIFKKSKADGRDTHQKELGEDYYLEYDYVFNGMGGFHPINIVLKNHRDIKCNQVITDSHGDFTKFPGVEKGAWEKELDGQLHPGVEFTFSVSRFVDGVCYIIWLVQPDGRYFADEDGFGAERYSEIELYNRMNTEGEFMQPFTEKRLEGCGNCFTLY